MAHEGQRIPAVTFKMRERTDEIGQPNPYVWVDKTTADLFQHKRVAVFSLPGAFTPTCTTKQLPEFEEVYYAQLISCAIDAVYCISVNDAFVMKQWADKLKVEKIQMIPDGNGLFTKGMNMLVKKENLGFGVRSWRYSMVVDNMVIQKMWVEPGKMDNAEDDPYTVTQPKHMYEWCKGQYEKDGGKSLYM